MTFNNETSVMPCEDGRHLPTVQFDFTGIGDLESKSKDSLVGKSVMRAKSGHRWSRLHRTWGRREASARRFTFSCAVTRASPSF